MKLALMKLTKYSLLLCLVLLAGPRVWADDYASQWAPPVGTLLPVLEAQDHTGELRTLANLGGEQGLLLFLNRSADW